VDGRAVPTEPSARPAAFLEELASEAADARRLLMELEQAFRRRELPQPAVGVTRMPPRGVVV